jgi:DNA repair protein RadC
MAREILIRKSKRKEEKKEVGGNIKKREGGAGEMAQWLRVPTALPKVLSSNPNNHMVAHNHPEQNLMPSSGVSEDSYNVLTLLTYK